MNKNMKSVRLSIGLKYTFFATLALFFLSIAVLLASIYNRDFCEWYCLGISAFIRGILSSVTGFFSFSLAEIVLFLLPVLLIVVVLISARSALKHTFSFKIFLVRFCCLLFSAVFLFINAFAICHFRYPIEKQFELDKKELTSDMLYDAALYVKVLAEDASANVEFDDSGASENPHTWDEMNELLSYGYDRLSGDYPFISRVKAKAKRIILSPIMTYTHISGIYVPFTGEANVNTNYPDYVVSFTMAHEMAHQRGIAGEDEANFIAFLACLASEDEYLVYSAYMNMYDYFLDAAITNERAMYTSLVENTNNKLLGEMYAYYLFFQEYRHSTASKVADTVNDTYLKAMGEDEGTKSYGKVVELFCAFMEKYRY